ncbi:MAG: hypothetical protein D6772_12915 [Bacteroidetes bacterium]|nr:MAG: hypothetical protein D6772_12915 [Bacteroidota bacterium]
MKKQPSNRMYNFPDADLYLQAMERLKYAKRDIQQFEQYGYGKDKLKAFAAMCQKFSALPSDDEVLGDQMLMTEKKNAAAEKLKSAIRSVMTRVAMKYGNRSGRYRKFGTAKMGDMTDAQLLFCGRRVARVARAQLDFLADVGVNENVIQKVTEACRLFENALNIQQDKIADRDIAVERRTEQGNKLYRELVVLCNIGKDIWAEKDPVKYENYTIYESNNEQKKARKARQEVDK